MDRTCNTIVALFHGTNISRMIILENICDFIFTNLLVVGIDNTVCCLVVLQTRPWSMASIHTANMSFTVENYVYRYHSFQHTWMPFMEKFWAAIGSVVVNWILLLLWWRKEKILWDNSQGGSLVPAVYSYELWAYEELLLLLALRKKHYFLMKHMYVTM